MPPAIGTAYVVASEAGDVQVHHAACPEQAVLARAAADSPQTATVYRVGSGKNARTVLVKPVMGRFVALISKQGID